MDESVYQEWIRQRSAASGSTDMSARVLNELAKDPHGSADVRPARRVVAAGVILAATAAGLARVALTALIGIQVN